MNDYYSPYTSEHIPTDSPAPWMGRAGVDCPAYDSQTQTAFWRGGGASWIIENVIHADPVPASVSRAQGKAALIQAGRWDDVLTFVADIQEPAQKTLADVALNDTQDWRRDSPFLNQCADALGITSAELDALFVAAAKIVL